MITSDEFVKKLIDVANNYKTLYVMGCFGAPLTKTNKERYINHNPYNAQPTRVKCIQNATNDTFGFDCVCLIKGILWGWNGDTKNVYGGAKYRTNRVPDIDADMMFNECYKRSDDFSDVSVGEALWCKRHIGVYIGNGLAVECTPAWKNRVQITAVKNIGTKAGYPSRKWSKHGFLPYVKYPNELPPKDPIIINQKIDIATEKDNSLTGSYEVVAPIGAHIRSGAGTNKRSLGVLKRGTIVKNYGYFNTTANNSKWLYVVTPSNDIGYCSLRYLKRI